MSYGDSYPNEVALMEDHQFARTRSLNELCDYLDGVKFALQSERTKGIEIATKLNKVYGGDLFHQDKQFPAGQSYIDLHSNDWPDKLDQIITALNYKPPENAFIVGNTSDNKNFHSQATAGRAAVATINSSKSDASDDARNVVDPSERQKFEKAMVSYFKGITSIRNQIGQKVGIFNRRHFENHFSLKWS